MLRHLFQWLAIALYYHATRTLLRPTHGSLFDAPSIALTLLSIVCFLPLSSRVVHRPLWRMLFFTLALPPIQENLLNRLDQMLPAWTPMLFAKMLLLWLPFCYLCLLAVNTRGDRFVSLVTLPLVGSLFYLSYHDVHSSLLSFLNTAAPHLNERFHVVTLHLPAMAVLLFDVTLPSRRKIRTIGWVCIKLFLVLAVSLYFHYPLSLDAVNARLGPQRYMIVDRGWSNTGYISVLHAFASDPPFTFLRCDHSILGGHYVMPSENGTSTYESIFKVFTMQEAVRLVEPRCPDTKARALVLYSRDFLLTIACHH